MLSGHETKTWCVRLIVRHTRTTDWAIELPCDDYNNLNIKKMYKIVWEHHFIILEIQSKFKMIYNIILNKSETNRIKSKNNAV